MIPCKARTFLWDPLPPLPLCDEPALKVDLFELKETIKTINAHRDKHIDHATRLDASVGSMIWTGDDADTTREQWEHIQGPRSLTQSMTGLMGIHAQNIEDFTTSTKKPRKPSMATATNQHPHTIQFNLHPHCPLSIVNCPLINGFPVRQP